MAGDAGLRATRLGRLEAVTGMAGIALGSYRVALNTGLDFGLRLVSEVRCIHRPFHRQHMAWKAVTGFIPELTVLFFVAATAHPGRREP